jgi:aldehyde:ferredoxin oxidoreductase
MSYAGTILWVDLTERKIEKEPTSKYVRDYVGGLGIGTKIFWDNVPPEITGTDPKNMLIFSTGPLTGTLLGNKMLVITKSPLMTNYPMQNAGMGGQLPSEIKFAGYDHIVITGKSDTPVYLYINNDEVEIRDAEHIWGSDVYKTQSMIKDELKDPDVQVAAIGPAGENQVAYSLILHDINHTASKGGHGAVMGSKNLKALAVRGTKGLKIADPEKFMKIWNKYFDYYTKGRGSTFTKVLNREGISQQCEDYIDEGIYGWGYFDSWVNPKRGKEERMGDFFKKYHKGALGCTACFIQCHDNFECEGIGGGCTCFFYAGFRMLVRSTDLKLWWKSNQLCQSYGLDLDGTAAIASWMMKLHELGIITAEDTDGVPMEWDDEEVCRIIIEKIAKGEGFGKILKDGIIPAAQQIGGDAIEHAMQLKNVAMGPINGAPIGATAGVYQVEASSEVWVHPPETDFHASIPWYAREMGVSKKESKKILEGWCDEHAERTTGHKDSWREESYDTYADYAVVNEAAIALCDIAGHCDWLSDRIPGFGGRWDIEDMAGAINAATGMSFTADTLTDAHKRRRLLEMTHIQLCNRAHEVEEFFPVKMLEPKQDG